MAERDQPALSGSLTPTGQARAALVRYLYALADDELVIGHRNSEWTGLGPILEEDIAFSSIAQDELGHALTYYSILEELGEGDPDTLAFGRSSAEFRNATLVEQPRGDYAFSLMRQLLYDLAESVRLEALGAATFAPLAQAARKIGPEERYHLMHAASYTRRLARGGPEALGRLQRALDAVFPGGLGLFEPVEGEAALVEASIAPSSRELAGRWLVEVAAFLRETGLTVPVVEAADGSLEPTVEPAGGGRQGRHTPHLGVLLAAMQLVYRADPAATW